MSNIINTWKSWAPYIRSMLRISAAALFMLVGTAKLFAFPIAVTPTGAVIPIMSLIGLAGMLEVFGGLLMLLGLFTRPTAFVLSGEMAVAYFMAHFAKSAWPMLNGGTDAILFSFIFLYFSSAGAGHWSLDAWRGKH